MSVVWLPVLKAIVKEFVARQEALYSEVLQSEGIIQLSNIRVNIDLKYGNAPYVHNKVYFQDSCKSYVNCLALLNDWPVCIHRIRNIYATFPEVFIEVKTRPFSWFCYQPTAVETHFAKRLMWVLAEFERFNAHSALVLCEKDQILFYNTEGLCIKEVTFIDKIASVGTWT